MGIFHFFSKKKKPTLLVRCTYCYYEFDLSPREVRLLETKNAEDPVCPVKELCDICHIGFMIPLNYTDELGKSYLFHESKPKIKNLNPHTVMERFYRHHF